MKNKKNKKWSGFFTNMLGVMLGISLTFGVNALWQRHEEKKNTKEILILVRNELVSNKDWFINQGKLLKDEVHAYRVLLDADKNWATIPKDSLIVYLNRLGKFSFTQLSTFAWQIFQNSEITQKISDKKLIFFLTYCYDLINNVHDFVTTNYWDLKMKALVFEADIVPEDLYDWADITMSKKEIIHFLNIAITSYNAIESLFFDVDAAIDYSISLLDKYGNFRYDTDEIAKEFQSFLEARRDSVRNVKK